MKLAEYTTHAGATAIYPLEHGVAYTALGLVSEVGDLAELGAGASVPDFEAELGDVLWYLAMAAKELGVAPEQINGESLTVEPTLAGDAMNLAKLGLVAAAGYLAGRAKKRLRDGHEAVSDEVIVTALNDVLRQINRVADFFDFKMTHVAKTNIGKLSSRADRGVLSGDGDHR